MRCFLPQILISGFALLTAIFAGAALGRWFGLPANEGAYLTLLLLAVVGWFAERRARHWEERP
jgi:hypothetical protein